MRARLRRFELPLARPLVTADGTIDVREGFLVFVETDGTAGVGEATPLPGWTESLDRCRERLDGALARLEAGGRDGALADLDDAPAARHGLSLALLDLDARRAGEPLSRFLDTDVDPAESIPVNATVGDGTVEETVEEACAAVAEGIDCVKVKVGARSPGVDAARLGAVREEVGDAVALRADANGAWSLGVAREAIDSFPPVEYVEQPLDPGDLAGHADLRGETTVALDETLAAHSVEEVLRSGAADVLVLKPMVLGGIDRAVRVIRDARERGVEVVVSTTIDGVVARTAAVHLAGGLGVERACGLATAGRFASDLAADPAPVDDGDIEVPDDPGHGVTIEG